MIEMSYILLFFFAVVVYIELKVPHPPILRLDIPFSEKFFV